MKKIAVSLLALLLLSLLTLGVVAAEEQNTQTLVFTAAMSSEDGLVSESGEIVLEAGDELSVSVSAGAWTGAIGTGQFALNYDATKLEIVEDGIVVGQRLTPSQSPNGGKVKVTCTNVFPTATTLLTVRFRVLEDVHGALEFSVNEISVYHPTNWNKLPHAVDMSGFSVASVHTLGMTQISAPGCTEQGFTRNLCVVCNTMFKSDFVDALGHDESGAAATCETPKLCAREDCGEIIEPALGHRADPNHNSCLTDTYCINPGCGALIQVAPGEHDATGPDATCTTDKVCANGCGTVLEEKKGHLPGAQATCTTAQVCTREECGAVIVPALGHLPGEAATCTTAQLCTREGCGVELAAALGHTFNVEAPACGVAKVCTVCSFEEAAALEHVFGEWQTVREATRKEDGEQTRSCTLCSAASETRTVAFDGPSIGRIVLTVVLIVLAVALFVLAVIIGVALPMLKKAKEEGVPFFAYVKKEIKTLFKKKEE